LTAVSPAAPREDRERSRSRLFPALDWLRHYDVANLRPDIVAGITLSAYLLPAGLGDASLANLPVEAGLYACLFSGLVFWLFCSSRHTAITVTSAISLLVGTNYFGDLIRDPANQREPGVFIFRVDGALLYFNVVYVSDRLTQALAQRADDVRLVVFFMGASPNIDLAGADLLEELRHSFEARGVAFRVAEARGNVRDSLQRAGFGGSEGRPKANQTVRDVIDAWRTEAPGTD